MILSRSIETMAGMRGKTKAMGANEGEGALDSEYSVLFALTESPEVPLYLTNGPELPSSGSPKSHSSLNFNRGPNFTWPC